MDTGRQAPYVEIQEEADADSGKSEIGQHLRFVDVDHLLDGLELHKHLAFDDQVCAKGCVQHDAFEPQWDRNLLPDFQTVRAKAMDEAGSIRAFEQSRS